MLYWIKDSHIVLVTCIWKLIDANRAHNCRRSQRGVPNIIRRSLYFLVYMRGRVGYIHKYIKDLGMNDDEAVYPSFYLRQIASSSSSIVKKWPEIAIRPFCWRSWDQKKFIFVCHLQEVQAAAISLWVPKVGGCWLSGYSPWIKNLPTPLFYT